jgi:hydrogenase maturation factor
MTDDCILLADGGGGERMMSLVRREILSRFAPGGRGELARLADAARIELPDTTIAATSGAWRSPGR